MIWDFFQGVVDSERCTAGSLDAVSSFNLAVRNRVSPEDVILALGTGQTDREAMQNNPALFGATPYGNLAALLARMDPTSFGDAGLLESRYPEQTAAAASSIPLYRCGGADRVADTQRLLFFVGCPRLAIVRAMTEDVLPSAAVAEWIAAARTILAMSERDPHLVELVSLDRAAECPDVLAEYLPGVKVVSEPQAEAARSPLLLGSTLLDKGLMLIADRTLSHHPDAESLYSELINRTHTEPGMRQEGLDGRDVDPDAAYLSYRSLMNQSRRFREDEPVWLHTTAHLREVMDLRKHVYENELSLLKDEMSLLRDETVHLAQMRVQLSEADLLSQELHEGLAAAMAAAAKSESMVTGLESQLREKDLALQAAESAISRLKSSTSWRITAPLRLLASSTYRVLGRGRK